MRGSCIGCQFTRTGICTESEVQVDGDTHRQRPGCARIRLIGNQLIKHGQLAVVFFRLLTVVRHVTRGAQSICTPFHRGSSAERHYLCLHALWRRWTVVDVWHSCVAGGRVWQHQTYVDESSRWPSYDDPADSVLKRDSAVSAERLVDVKFVVSLALQAIRVVDPYWRRWTVLGRLGGLVGKLWE